MMKKLLKILLICVVISAVLVGWQRYQLNRKVVPEPLPANVIEQVVVTPRQVTIKRRGQPTKVIPVPKTDSIVLQRQKQGESEIIHEPSILPSLVVLPQLGLGVGSRIEPLLGLQLLRSERLKIGASVNLTPSSIGLGLERDILANSCLGLVYAQDIEGYTRMYVKFATFF